MKNKLIIPILFLALVAAGGWGYSQYQMKRQWEVNAENQYQRAFQDLNGHVSNMETSLSKAMVAGSFSQIVQQLTNTWRESNSCQENLGQLPLTSVELARTKMLFAKVSAFCFNDAQTKLTKGNVRDETEWKNLQAFRNQTRLVARHLSNLQQSFYTNRAQWLQVDRLGTIGATGLASSELNNNKVTKAFIMLEDGLKRVPDIQFHGNNLDFVPKPTGLTGSNITPREAVTVARRLLPELSGWRFSYERTIKGGFPSYMIMAVDPKRGRDHRFSISKKGGHVVWVLGNRTVARARLTQAQCESKAKALLARNSFSEMDRVSTEVFSNIATFTFVPVVNKVLRYPELVKVQVAMDNGEILGYDAVPYLTFYNPAENVTPKPKYSEAQIRKLLNPHFQPTKIELAQVLDEMYNKVTCYEVSGSQSGDRYMLYYNADTGKEEKIRRVDRNGNEIT